MTRRRAERLTGYEIRRMVTGDSGFRYAAFDGADVVAESWHADERLALDRLVARVYARHRELVLERHAWQCARCGRSRSLQIHHRKFRSHGGTHRTVNLEPVCWECHDLIHRIERSK